MTSRTNFSQIIKNENYLVFKNYGLFPFDFSCCQVIWWHLSFVNNFRLLMSSMGGSSLQSRLLDSGVFEN